MSKGNRKKDKRKRGTGIRGDPHFNKYAKDSQMGKPTTQEPNPKKRVDVDELVQIVREAAMRNSYRKRRRSEDKTKPDRRGQDYQRSFKYRH